MVNNMLFYKKVIKIFSILLLIQNIISAQDSLYLIGTIQGISVDEPIFKVNKAGDINGDGYDDFITTIPRANYCNIYLGSKNIDFSPDIVLHHPPEIYDFGFFLGDVGDVNKDGYDDVVIQGKYDPLFFIGQVFLYLGGENVDTIPDFTFRDNFIQDALGASISGGDVNGDGYSDFIVGNPYNWTNGIGRAYLFLGGETISDTPAVTFISDSLEDFFGYCVSMNGDVNGDGCNDIIITAPNIHGVDYLETKIFFYFGDSDLFDIPDDVLNFQDIYGTCSFYVSDYSNDGYDDFFVINANRLYLGSSFFSSDKYLVFSSNEEKDSFGGAAGNAGDINNDGFDDLIIGASNHRNQEDIMVGGAYIFFGSSEPDTTPEFFIEGETKWSHFGWKVGSLGDLNGDGFDEIYVLADGYPDYENPLGKVYVYSMKKLIVDVESEIQGLPSEFKLYQCFPNPFNPTTEIKYQLAKSCFVRIDIYNTLGEKLYELVNEYQNAGVYSVQFDGSKLSSGTYLYKMQTDNFTYIKKMLLIK